MKTKKNNRNSAIASFFLVLFGSTAIILGILLYRQQENLSGVKEQAALEKEQMSTEYREDFLEIENNISEILAHENLIESTVFTENDMTRNEMRKRLRDEIQLIDNLIAENKTKIDKLNKEIGDQNIRFHEYEAKMKKLSGRLNKYKQRVEDLVAMNEKLNTDLEIASTENKELQTTLETRDREILDQLKQLENKDFLLAEHRESIEKLRYNTSSAYFRVGTFKELKNAEVVEKEGGILGIGATKELRDNFDKTEFTRIDKYEYTSIPVFSKKAELATNHDPASYNWIENDQEVKWLEITDPEIFWQQSRYLVVVTKERRTEELVEGK